MKKSDQKKVLQQSLNVYDEIAKLAELIGLDETSAAKFTSNQLGKIVAELMAVQS
tara:strand:- start:675 stop:839 length:165 start_codon:yes stop_codon:yes gene_type:complete